MIKYPEYNVHKMLQRIKELEDRLYRVEDHVGLVEPEVEHKIGDKVLCVYGHYEGKYVTVTDILPGNKNIGPIIYYCEAGNGEMLTLGPLDVA